MLTISKPRGTRSRKVLRSSLALLFLAAFASAHGRVAFAGPTPFQKCQGAKLKAAGKKMAAKTVCHQKALSRATAVDPACLQKAEGKFLVAFAKADAVGSCAAASGTAADVEAHIDACLVTFTGAIAGDPKCAGAKIKATGRKVLAKLTCHQHAVLKGGAVDPACLVKAEAQFAAAFAKADGAGACSGLAGSVELLVDECVSAFVNGPILTTTTTTTSTSTTSTSTTTTTSSTTSTSSTSTTSTSQTTTSTILENCCAFGLVNGDAEMGPGGDGFVVEPIPGWTTLLGGAPTVVLYGAPGGFPTASDPGPPVRGLNFFAGGNAPASPPLYPSIYQSVDVSPIAAAIDAGMVTYDLSGFFGGYASQPDSGAMEIDFVTAVGGFIDRDVIGPVGPVDRGAVTGLLYRASSGTLPPGTRNIDVYVYMIAPAPYNDGYADDVQLHIRGCSGGAVCTTTTLTPASTSTSTSTTTSTSLPPECCQANVFGVVNGCSEGAGVAFDAGCATANTFLAGQGGSATLVSGACNGATGLCQPRTGVSFCCAGSVAGNSVCVESPFLISLPEICTDTMKLNGTLYPGLRCDGNSGTCF